MSTETQQPVNDPAIIEGEVIEVKTPEAALAVMNPGEYGKQLMEPYVKQLTAARRKATTSKFDIKTKDGMTSAKQLKKLFVTIRTTADEAKANAKRPIDAAGAAILAEYKIVEAGAKAEEARIAALITAEEKRLEDEKQAKIAAERARIEAIEERLVELRSMPATLALAASSTIQKCIDALLADQLDPKDYQEFLDEAAEAKIATVEKLREHLTAALAREEAARIAQENAEKLARLEAEQAERDKAAAEAKRIADEQAAAVARQAQDMQDIMAINMVVNTAPGIETRAQLAEELAKVQAFDPARYGTIQNMADMAKTLATNALQARLAQLPEDPQPEPEVFPSTLAFNSTSGGWSRRAPAGITYGSPPCENFASPAAETEVDHGGRLVPMAEVFPECPPAAEVLDVLAKHYQVDKETVNVWMIDLRDDFMKLEV